MQDKRVFKIRFIGGDGGGGAKPTDFDAAGDAAVEYAGQPVVVVGRKR
jgi:alpha-D-xyloside xylohydrolase